MSRDRIEWALLYVLAFVVFALAIFVILGEGLVMVRQWV